MGHLFYEAVLVDRTPTQLGPPTFTEVDRIQMLDKVSWSKELNNDGFGSVSTRPNRLSSDLATRLRSPEQNPMELWIYREGVKVYAGPLIGIQVQGAESTITFHSRGLLYYLRYMFLTQDYSATATDKFTVAKDLVDHWQNLDWGDFGIDTSGIGTSGDTIDADYKRTEIVNIARELARLSNPGGTNGFDFEIDPATRDLIFYDPQKGTDKSATHILDSRNMRQYSAFMDLTAGDFATTVVGAATGFELDGALWSQATDTVRRDQFGLVGLGASWNNLQIQSTLDDFVQTLVDIHSDFRLSFGGAGGAESGGGTTVIPMVGFEPEDVEPGDTISVNVDFGFGEYALQRDVSRVVTSQTADGNEEMNVTVL